MKAKTYILTVLREGLEHANHVGNQKPYVDLIRKIKLDEIDCNFELGEEKPYPFILTEAHLEFMNKEAKYCEENPRSFLKPLKTHAKFNKQILVIRSMKQAWLRSRDYNGNWPSWTDDHKISISSASFYETDPLVERLEHKPEHK